MGRPKFTPEQRKESFWNHVEQASEHECWPWKGRRDLHGYGVHLLPSGKTTKAHRTAWTYTHGPIPDGLRACHRCDNPPCCNPTHLFLGTAKDNTQDAVSKGRMSRGTHRWNSKLTENDIRAIRASTDTLEVIGQRFGITYANAGYIRRGRTWKHIK